MTVLPITGHQTSVALFMPAFNESANLAEVVSRAHAFFDRMHIQQRSVIVVDDGSTDDTQATLAAIAHEHDVEIVTHAVNSGYGRALRTGLTAALATGHEWIAYCDSDGQFNPADLAMLLVAADSHQVPVVLGIRVKRADNMIRRIAGRGWHGVSRLVLKYQASDVDCGFKLLHRSVVAAVAAELQSDYAAISPELLARIARAGYRFVEVPVPHYPRANGTQTGLDPKVVMRSFADLFAVRRELGVGHHPDPTLVPVESAAAEMVSTASREAV
jgi:glycosyltransferase involved in cell wall biosynthesis